MTATGERLAELLQFITDWKECPVCKIVTKDYSQGRLGVKCRTCNKKMNERQNFYNYNIYATVELIKEAITSDHHFAYPGAEPDNVSNTHFIAVVLFFCTLREILMNDLIRNLHRKNGITEANYRKAIEKFRGYSQKQNSLFPNLTGKDWEAALARLSKRAGRNYVALNEQVKSLVEKRNTFTHEGERWGIGNQVALDCVDAIEPLLRLYIDIHNEYVHVKWLAASK